MKFIIRWNVSACKGGIRVFLVSYADFTGRKFILYNDK